VEKYGKAGLATYTLQCGHTESLYLTLNCFSASNNCYANARQCCITHTLPDFINPLKTKRRLLYFLRPSSYRAVNTFHLGYKNQSVYYTRVSQMTNFNTFYLIIY